MTWPNNKYKTAPYLEDPYSQDVITALGWIIVLNVGLYEGRFKQNIGKIHQHRKIYCCQAYLGRADLALFSSLQLAQFEI